MRTKRRQAALPPLGMTMDTWVAQLVAKDFANRAPVIDLAERLGRSIPNTVAVLQRIPGLKAVDKDQGVWMVTPPEGAAAHATAPAAARFAPVPAAAPAPKPATVPPRADPEATTGKFAIEDGVPLVKGRVNPLVFRMPLESIQVGQSFLVPDSAISDVKNPQMVVTHALTKHKAEGQKFTARKVPEGVRVWRTE